MRDSSKCHPAVKHKPAVFVLEQLVEDRSAACLVPTLADKCAAVLDRLIHVGVVDEEPICEKGDVGGDAHLPQQHEELVESRLPRTRFAEEPFAPPYPG